MRSSYGTDFREEPLHILSGNVLYGWGIGKLVGMPTANMEVSDKSTLPLAGVYITEILLDGQVYDGITNTGTSAVCEIGGKIYSYMVE